MTTPVTIEKRMLSRFLECIRKGKPVNPAGGVWDHWQLLALAGVCRYALITHGPTTVDRSGQAIGMAELEASCSTDEQLHMVCQLFVQGVSDAIEWAGDRTGQIELGEYDQNFEAEHIVILGRDGETRTMHPVSGFKNFAQND